MGHLRRRQPLQRTCPPRGGGARLLHLGFLPRLPWTVVLGTRNHVAGPAGPGPSQRLLEGAMPRGL